MTAGHVPLSRSAAFGFAFVTSLVLWLRPISSTVSLALADERYTYVLLVAPLVTWILLRASRDPGRTFKSVPIAFVVLPLSGVAAFAAFRSTLISGEARLTMEILCLTAWWIAAYIACFGLGTSKLERFALEFLVLGVPLPPVVMDRLVDVLQWGSVFATEGLFKLFQVPVLRDGTKLQIPGLDVNIAGECSSIRSTTFLLLATVLIAHLVLESSWKKWLVVLLVIPISVARNGFRIFTISVLATELDSSFLTGRLHRSGGVVFYLGSLLVVGLCMFWLTRGTAGRRTEPGGDLSRPGVPLRGKSASL